MVKQNNKPQPQPVKKINCPKCGELEVKIYPYSSLQITDLTIPICQKCMGKAL